MKPSVLTIVQYVLRFTPLPIFLMGCATVKTHYIQSISAEFLGMATLVMPPPRPHAQSLQISMHGVTAVGESMGPMNSKKPRLKTRILEWSGDGDGDRAEHFLASPGDYRIDWDKVGYHARYFIAPNERLSLFGSAQGGQVNGDLFTALQLGMNIAFLFPHITFTVTPALGWQDNRITYRDSVVEYYRNPTFTDSIWVEIREAQSQYGHPQTAIALTLSRPASPSAVFIPFVGYQYAVAWVRRPPYPSDVLRVGTSSWHAGLRIDIARDLAVDATYSWMDLGNRHGSRNFSRAEASLIHAFGESH